ncbi:MAG: MgtC/SapB family protein [Candidatus Eremiobacteraeota bacterium]|nr:MgtC/SapB family protein [Candidatus Eremiobacteraeota bacterium]
MTLLDFTIRLLIALALGTVVGLERQYRQRMAGLRTNALVSVGAALFVMLSPFEPGADPTRVAAQVVSGIGFLAGGVIFREGLSVRGLNTAATLWATAAVGTLAGLGHLEHAAIGAGAILAANVMLRPIARRINLQPIDDTEVVSTYELRAVCRQDVEDRVRQTMVSAIRGTGITLHAVYSEDINGSNRVEIVADVAVAGRADARLEKVVSRLGVEPGVTAVSWKLVPTADEEQAMLPEA